MTTKSGKRELLDTESWKKVGDLKDQPGWPTQSICFDR